MATLTQALEQARALVATLEALEGLEAATLPAPSGPPPPGPLAWGAKVSQLFRDRVQWIGSDLGFDPNWLMAVMAFETGRRFTADVKNPGSSATGLIQFMRSTAVALGTTVEALALLTPEDQLNFVWKYMAQRIRERGPIVRLSDCYMAVLNPVAMGKPDSFVMWVMGSSAYSVNAGLDVDKNHSITKAEAASKVHATLAEGLKTENVSA